MAKLIFVSGLHAKPTVFGAEMIGISELRVLIGIFSISEA
jgi:hypothetical protein